MADRSALYDAPPPHIPGRIRSRANNAWSGGTEVRAASRSTVVSALPGPAPWRRGWTTRPSAASRGHDVRSECRSSRFARDPCGSARRDTLQAHGYARAGRGITASTAGADSRSPSRGACPRRMRLGDVAVRDASRATRPTSFIPCRTDGTGTSHHDRTRQNRSATGQRVPPVRIVRRRPARAHDRGRGRIRLRPRPCLTAMALPDPRPHMESRQAAALSGPERRPCDLHPSLGRNRYGRCRTARPRDPEVGHDKCEEEGERNHGEEPSQRCRDALLLLPFAPLAPIRSRPWNIDHATTWEV